MWTLHGKSYGAACGGKPVEGASEELVRTWFIPLKCMAVPSHFSPPRSMLCWGRQQRASGPRMASMLGLSACAQSFDLVLLLQQGFQDPNSDIIEIFETVEKIPQAPKKLLVGDE